MRATTFPGFFIQVEQRGNFIKQENQPNLCTTVVVFFLIQFVSLGFGSDIVYIFSLFCYIVGIVPGEKLLVLVAQQ